MKKSILFSSQNINTLNFRLSSIRPGMVLCYQYCPKLYKEPLSDKEAFWLAITNIYSLFYDCSGFLFRRAADHYNNDNVLSILKQGGYISRIDQIKIKTFIRHLNAIRSYYCHNKISGFNDTIGIESNFTSLEKILVPDSLRDLSTYTNYKPSCDELRKNVDYIFSILDNSIKAMEDDRGVNKRKVDELTQKWVELQAKWLINTREIYETNIRYWYNIQYYQYWSSMDVKYDHLGKFKELCMNKILSDSNINELNIAIEKGNNTILGILQLIYNAHEKEIKKSFSDFWLQK